MTNLKGLQRLLLCSAFAVLAFGAAPAKATTDTSFGSCIGSATNDCVTTTGHISASVVGTLSINEMRAISFGNFAVPVSGTGDATIVLDPTGVRTATSATDQIVLLNGGGAALGGRAGDPGSQSPGHYTVSAGAEGGATQGYISFATSAGVGIDACSPNGGTGGAYAGGYTGAPGTCDNYHPGSAVTLTGLTPNAFTVDQFTFNESGSDVFGHYINEAAKTGPGIGNPFLPGTGAVNTGHNNGTGTPGGAGAAQAIDVVVGATLHTTAVAAVLPGKYTGTFDVMVSY
jgi:hypothetical protein